MHLFNLLLFLYFIGSTVDDIVKTIYTNWDFSSVPIIEVVYGFIKIATDLRLIVEYLFFSLFVPRVSGLE